LKNANLSKYPPSK